MKGTVPKGIVVDFAAYRRRTKTRSKQQQDAARSRDRDQLIDEVAYYLLMAAKAIQSHS
jgi:hypothetical protein